LFSLVTVEALREGTPVIVRNIGAMPEIVQASAGGFVYNTDEELAAAMDRLLADLSFRDELGNRGHQAYQRNWTPDVYMDRYLALIGELGATRGQPRAEALVFDECQRELISNLESEI
jgi:glycosyltransferase involved in cell wall biosynthesis